MVLCVEIEASNQTNTLRRVGSES